MTKEEFADIMLQQLKEWSNFIDLDDELPWNNISEEKMFELIDFVNNN